MDEYTKNVIRQFLEANWSSFEQHCGELEVDPEAALSELEAQ